MAMRASDARGVVEKKRHVWLRDPNGRRRWRNAVDTDMANVAVRDRGRRDMSVSNYGCCVETIR